MVLPVIQTMSNMSNEQLEKYKELYSQLIVELVGLHNTHLSFIKHVGRDTGTDTRRHIREVVRIATELKRQGQKVCKEEMANKRLAKQQKKENKNKKKRNDLVISK